MEEMEESVRESQHLVTCIVAGHSAIEFMIDSGAELNVLTESDWSLIKRGLDMGQSELFDIDTQPRINVRAYATTEALKAVCSFKAWIKTKAGGKPETFAEFIVIQGGTKSLLGRRTATEMRLLMIGLSVNLITKQQPRKFPSMPGVEIDFDIDEKVPPIRNAYVSIPLHFREAANQRLNEMEQSEIIEKVKTAPRWISGMSAVPKGKNDFRLIVNMRGPNKAIRRQFHQMPRVEEMKAKLSGAKIFTKLDLHSAFHHVEISERSRDLTTFMAPNGMYRFKRLVFGVNCAPEIFQRLMEEILMGIPNVIIYIDDILIYAESVNQLQQTTEKVVEALRGNNLTLNEDKCVRQVEKLTFLGHELSSQGFGIDEQKVKDIRKFREPRTVSELKSFLGLASFVSTFIPRFADMTEPLWRVTGKNAFTWNSEQAAAFEEVKEAIASCTTSQGYFSLDDKTFLYSDASPHALGAVLVQQDEGGKHRIISFASKSLTQTERRYAQTQREALAVVWGTEHFYYYLLGRKFTIRTDAQGIAYIFNRNGDAPKRIMRRAEGWAMRLDAFDFEIEYVKGRDNIADPSSRLYSGTDEAYADAEAPCEIAQITINDPAEIIFDDEHLPVLEIAYHTARDETLKAVSSALETDEWGPELNRFKAVADELHESNGILMRQGLAVIPSKLTNKALALAHKGHPGMTKMKSILRERVWWPSMGSAVEKWVNECRTCALNGRKEPPTPMERSKLPEAPWDFVAIDFNGPYAMWGGILIMTMVDYYSRYMLATTVKSTSLDSTCQALEQIFDLYGIPGAIKSDNGPPFNSEGYKLYCRRRGISPVFSWPLTPQQNGMVERSMQTINKAMQAASVEGTDYRKTLAEAVRAHNSAVHRTTNEVPSDLMFARKLRRSLPLAGSAIYAPDIDSIRVRDHDEKEKGKLREDKKRGARESRIMVGDKVVLRRGTKRKGESNYNPTELEVTGKRKGDLTMETGDGQIVKRHITMAKKVVGKPDQPEPVEQAVNQRPRRTIKAPDRYASCIDYFENE